MSKLRLPSKTNSGAWLYRSEGRLKITRIFTLPREVISERSKIKKIIMYFPKSIMSMQCVARWKSSFISFVSYIFYLFYRSLFFHSELKIFIRFIVV